MEQRDSFVFYRSFFEAVSKLKKSDQAEVLLALCDYALNGTERPLNGVPAAMFMLIKPNLDANQRKYENGKKGGRPKTKQKPNDNLTVTETEPNVGCLMGNVGCLMDNGGGGAPNPLAAVMSAYLDKINPAPSQTSLDELKGYTERMGAEVCLRAIDKALDAGKATWNYIRGILRSVESKGVRCIADWDRLEAERKESGSGASTNPNAARGTGADGGRWNLKSDL